EEGQLLAHGCCRPRRTVQRAVLRPRTGLRRRGCPEVDEDRYMEYWNLVFMEYELSAVRAKDDFDIAGDLPAKNIDTGMGMERMATLMQGVDNLYEIDETRPVLDRAAALAGKVYGAHSGHAASQSHPDDGRLRVIADHVRT